MKKFSKAMYFCLPVLIYIACSLLAFLLWNVFNYGQTPIISTSIILCVAGSFFSGFLSRGSYGKKGMLLTIALVVISVILWIIAYTSDLSPAAYAATVLSSYYFNIQSCLPYDTPEYIMYIGYAIALVVPITLILFGKFLGNKFLRKKV